MTPDDLKRAELDSLRLIKSARAAGDKKGELAGLRAIKQIRNVSGLAKSKAAQASAEVPAIQKAGQFYANPEAALSVATGVLAEPVAGLAGVVGAALPGEEGQAARFVEGTRSALTYQPRTEYGQAGLAALQPVGEAVQALEQMSGQGAVDLATLAGVDPNSKTAATIYGAGSTIPEVVGTLVGSRFMPRRKPGRPNSLMEPVGADDAARTADAPVAQIDDTAQRLEPEPVGMQLEPQPANQPRQPIVAQPTPKESPKKAELRQAIQQGRRDGAGFKIDRTGKVVGDGAAKKALSNGWDDRLVAGVKTLSPADKQAAARMMDIAEQKLTKFRTAEMRPSNVIGESVMKRWKVVSDANMQARKDINKAAESALRGRQIDISDALDSFMDDLEGLGIQSTDEGLEFRGSQIEGSNVAPLKRVVARLKAQDDGLNLHRLKQYIDSQIDWDKKPGVGKPLDEKAQSALKALRGKISERLKAESDAYADANARAAETFEAMGQIRDTFGRRFDPSSENVNAYAGRELRKVLSEYGVSDDMLSAIDRLDETAGKYGAKFDDDPVNLAQFYSHMEKRLGSFSPNSFQGKIEKSMAREGLEAASGSKLDLVAKGVDKAREMIRGPQDQAAINSLRELLRRQD